MSVTAIVRFWILAMPAYIFLEEERARLQMQWQRLSPSGRLGVKSNVAIGGICSTGFMGNPNPAFSLFLYMNFSRPETGRPKSANIVLLTLRAYIPKY